MGTLYPDDAARAIFDHSFLEQSPSWARVLRSLCSKIVPKWASNHLVHDGPPKLQNSKLQGNICDFIKYRASRCKETTLQGAKSKCPTALPDYGKKAANAYIPMLKLRGSDGAPYSIASHLVFSSPLPVLYQSPTIPIAPTTEPPPFFSLPLFSDGRSDHGIRCFRGPPIGVLGALHRPLEHPSALRPPLPRSRSVPQTLHLLVWRFQSYFLCSYIM